MTNVNHDHRCIFFSKMTSFSGKNENAWLLSSPLLSEYVKIFWKKHGFLKALWRQFHPSWCHHHMPVSYWYLTLWELRFAFGSNRSPPVLSGLPSSPTQTPPNAAAGPGLLVDLSPLLARLRPTGNVIIPRQGLGAVLKSIPMTFLVFFCLFPQAKTISPFIFPQER